MIKEDWLKSKTDKERSVMLRRAQITRITTLFGYVMIVFLVILVAILPSFGISLRYVTNITDFGKLMPLQTYYLYDTDRSPFYEITFILQSITVITAGTVYNGTDNFLGMMVFHVCGQLENLRVRILSFHENDFESNLSCIVQDHRRFIRFCICVIKSNKYKFFR